MNQQTAPGDYERLKARIVGDARRDLERTNPEYVAAFQASLLATGGDVDQAAAEAGPLLRGRLPKWPRLLTAFFDLEVAREKVVQCHAHMKQVRNSTAPDASYWFSYHLDHWTFQTDAFLERCNRLYTQVIRATIRERDPDGWEEFQNEIAADVKELKNRFGKHRHPVAHGLGGGVEGITEHWESVLASPVDVATDTEFVRSSMKSMWEATDIKRRKKWFRAVHRANLVLFAYSEAFAGRIIDKIEGLDS